MPVSKARKRSKKTGQGAIPGRFILSRQDHVVRLFGRVAAWGLMVVCICVLASSTLSDPLQKLTEAGINDTLRISGAQDFTSARQQERLALLRRIAADADAVRHLTQDELSLLFGTPSLKREEPEVVSWHFTSYDCALDVYFPRNHEKPVYAEYRVRGQAEETGLVEGPQMLDHKTCVKSLFSHAKFVEPSAPVFNSEG